MNLFYLDEDLDKCAEYHVDKHIVKMPLEVAQIMCTTIWIDVHLGFIPRALNKEERDKLNALKKEIKHLPPEERPLTPYLPMMYNHPCTIWARSSLETTNGHIAMEMPSMKNIVTAMRKIINRLWACLLYTSDAADE